MNSCRFRLVLLALSLGALAGCDSSEEPTASDSPATPTASGERPAEVPPGDSTSRDSTSIPVTPPPLVRDASSSDETGARLTNGNAPLVGASTDKAESEAAALPPADTTDWPPIPRNSQRLWLKFPAEPSEFDPLELLGRSGAEEEPSAARKLAQAFLAALEPIGYRVDEAGRRYQLLAAPLVFAGFSAENFAKRMGEEALRLNPGFASDQVRSIRLEVPEAARIPETELAAFEGRLIGGNKVRIVRIVPIGKVIVSLMVEGDESLGIDDPQVQGFFDSLGLGETSFVRAASDQAGR